MFRPDFDLRQARPASYNPRRISPESAAALRESIETLGILKAVIVGADGLILAGHQRSNQIAALDIERAPAILLESAVNATDQAKFNQLHNRCDLDFGAADLHIACPLSVGWHWIEAGAISGRATGYANERKEMCDLLAKYGPWGNVIAAESGRILVGGLYASCCALLRMPVLACIVPDERAPEIERFFGRSYGEFCYSHFERTTWVQGMAQKFRLRAVKGKSRTYENLVIPRLKPGLRILDFGAGQMDYVKALSARGVNIRGIEFYFRDGLSIDVAAAHRQIDELCADLRENGPFDLVVCDSVLNSVDSQQAEEDVLTCLSAFCRPGGTLIWSGRSSEDANLTGGPKNLKKTGKQRSVAFLDENGFTAFARRGAWQFQKYHDLAQIEAQSARFFGSTCEVLDTDGKRVTGRNWKTSWGAVATKAKTLDDAEILPALHREFDLPLPDGSSYARGSDIVNAYLAAK